VTAIALALGASLCWGTGDFLGGLGARRLSTLTVLAVSAFVGLLAVAVLVAVQGDAPPPGRSIALAACAGLAGALGLGALFRGMAVGAIAVVAPISSAAAVIPVVFGLVTGERPSGLQLAGMAVVLAGVALASREPGSVGRRLAAGVPLALLAALGFGLYFLLMDPASDDGAIWAVLVARSAATLAATAVALALRSGLPRAADLPLLATVGIFDAGANAMLAVALTKGLVGLVAVLSSLYPVVTVLLARAVLGERVASAQRAGVALALGGVAVIAAGG
jgi:drug/metabolite transporter (DMT)-like permease